MTVYVDTSVVLRILFHEPNWVAVWGRWNKAYSSALWRVEALRTVDRLHLATALSIREIENVDLLLTHDSRLATAARSLGFEVMGIDQ